MSKLREAVFGGSEYGGAARDPSRGSRPDHDVLRPRRGRTIPPRVMSAGRILPYDVDLTTMQVYNVHEREYAVAPDSVGALIASVM